MRSPFLLLLYLAVQPVTAQECQRFLLETEMPSNEKLPVSFFAGAAERTQGVLVLQPGINGASDAFLRDLSWQQFARKHRLVLMGVGFQTGKINVKTSGYYYPEQGSGLVMVRAIEAVCARCGIPKQPVLLFGFSAGAHFVHRFALWKPEMVRAYAVHAAGWWEKPTTALKRIPGLVSWGSDDYRKTATGDFAHEALGLGLPVVACEFPDLPHAVDERVKSLAQTFFEQTLVNGHQNQPGWIGDAQMKRTVRADSPEARQIPADRRIQFVSPILAEAWLSASKTNAASAPAASPVRFTSPAPSKVDLHKFTLEGNPASPEGATWTYESTDDGMDFKLNGTLFKPAGSGPFPAVLISHGMGNTAGSYGAKLSKEMVKWGLVCMAPNYTFAGNNRGEGAPGVSDVRHCNPTDNLKRVRKCLDILGAFGYVDRKRVAIHGHSMGAFLTVAIAGAFPNEIRAASHTAGGEQSYNKEYSLKLRAPYSIHHGDADTSVSIKCDERFEATLTQNKVEHEMHVYPGMTHPQISGNETVLERIRAWYRKHGVL